MSWNYRIGFKKDPSGFDEYGVVEAYYEDGNIVGVTGFITPYDGDSLSGLKWSLGKMLEACDKEVLNLDDMEGEKD